MFRLDGKIALVTGSSSGIGRAVAERFLKAGATVVGLDRIAATDGSYDTLISDVSSESDVSNAINETIDRHQKLDILVNNAGIQPLGVSLQDTTPQLLERTLSVNVHSVFWGVKHAKRAMGSGGRIINTGSFVGDVGVPDSSVYSVSKAAVMHLTKVSALELAPLQITVNSVCPGTTSTPAVTEIPDNPEIAFAEKRTPIGRLASTDEIAAAFHFLASDEASYITGVNLPVDGGIAAGWERYDTVAPAEFANGQWKDK